MAFLCGLALANLVTVAVTVPPPLFAVLRKRPDLLRRPRLVLGAFLCAGEPLISYLYIYLRGAAHPEWREKGDWATAQGWFWSIVSTSQGREELSWGLRAGAPFSGNGFPQLIWQELSLPILLLGLTGIALFHRRVRLLVWGTLFLYLALCWVDRFGNWSQVIMPAYPLVLLGLLPLAQHVQERLTQMTPLKLPGGVRLSPQTLIPVLVLLGATAWSLAASWSAADNRGRPEDTALARPALILSQRLPADIGLFGEYSDASGLDYLVSIWGVRPDLTVLSSREAGRYLAAGPQRRSHMASRPAPAQRTAPGGLRFQLQGIAPNWVLLATEGSGEHLPVAAIGALRAVGDGILLAGYNADESEGLMRQQASGCDACLALEESLDVTLFWQVEEDAAPGDWAISVRASAGGK